MRHPLEPKYKDLLDYAYEGVYEKLLCTVCGIMGVPAERVKSGSRKRELVEPRMIYLTLAQELYPHNTSMIARVAERDHATALGSAKTVHDVRELRQKYEHVKNQISWNRP